MRCTLFLLVASAVACGPSMARVEHARGAAYDADLSVVWQALRSSLSDQYGIAYESEPERMVVTCWRNGTSSGTPSDPTFRVTRIGARVIGGPPWSIEIVSVEATVRYGRAVDARRYSAYIENRLLVDVHDRIGTDVSHAIRPADPVDGDLLSFVATTPDGPCDTPSAMYRAAVSPSESIAAEAAIYY